MTISSNTNKSGPYNGNGSTVDFDYEFKIIDETHVEVILTGLDGLDTVLVLNTDYTVSGVDQDGGGQVTLNVAPASGEKITLILNVPFTQETNLENQGPYYAETIEAALDMAAQRDLQMLEQLDRAVKIPVSGDTSDLDTLIQGIIQLEGLETEIAAVAAMQTEIVVVDAISAQIVTVSGIAPEIIAVAAIAPQVSDVAAIDADVSTVAGIASDVSAVAANVDLITDIGETLIIAVDHFTGDGTETEFTMSREAATAANVIAIVGGVPQSTADYSVAGDVITFTAAPGNGTPIETRVIATASPTQTPADGSVTAAKLTANAIHGQAEKTTPVDADETLIWDSVANALKRLTFANLLAYVLGKVASAANYWSNTNGLLGVNNVWSAAVPVDLGTVTGNVTLDFGDFINAYMTTSGNITFNASSGLKRGQSGVIVIINGATHTLSLNATYFKTHGGAGIDLGTDRNILSYFVDVDDKVFLALVGRTVA